MSKYPQPLDQFSSKLLASYINELLAQGRIYEAFTEVFNSKESHRLPKVNLSYDNKWSEKDQYIIENSWLGQIAGVYKNELK